MKKGIILSTILLFNFIFISNALALTSEEQAVINLINEGVAHINEVGKDQAFKDFTDRKGKFVKGNLYIFVIKFDGTTLAHGGNARLIGKNLINLRDSSGKYFFKEFIKVGKSGNPGWVDYRWSNPKSKKIEDKTSYILSPPGTDYALGCGIYKK